MADTEGKLAPVTAPVREIELIVAGEHGDPHRILGLHEGVVRTYRPDAFAMRVTPIDIGDGPIEMSRIHPAGVFEAPVPEGTNHYHLEADYGKPGWVTTFTFHDPYRAVEPGEGELIAGKVGGDPVGQDADTTLVEGIDKDSVSDSNGTWAGCTTRWTISPRTPCSGAITRTS